MAWFFEIPPFHLRNSDGMRQNEAFSRNRELLLQVVNVEFNKLCTIELMRVCFNYIFQRTLFLFAYTIVNKFTYMNYLTFNLFFLLIYFIYIIYII